MSLRVAVTHRTTCRFDRRVRLGPQVARLKPSVGARLLTYALGVDPEESHRSWQTDPYGNSLARLVFDEPSDHLDLEVAFVVDLDPVPPLDPSAATDPFEYGPAERSALAPYLEAEEAGPLLKEYLGPFSEGRAPTVEQLVALSQDLARRIEARRWVGPAPAEHQRPPEATLAAGAGSHRDVAWLLVQALRALGVAARFVSGYLVQLEGAGVEAAGAELHAWAEAWLPGAGWVGLDPTSGRLAGEGHLVLAAGPRPEVTAPLSGTTEPCRSRFETTGTAERVGPGPDPGALRGEWAEIDALGRAVDLELTRLGVRLTVGGEPTFVATEGADAPEWKVAPDGPRKRELAERLIVSLRDRLAPGAILHHGLGKWYAGEPAPRWRRSAHWRADGDPVWSRPELLATVDDGPGSPVASPERFALGVAQGLGLDGRSVVPGYEDPLYHLWLEHTLPVDQDPGGPDLAPADLDETGERGRLAQVLDRRLGAPVGWVLPLAWDEERWHTSTWRFRREELFLFPSAWPMGSRLPLDRLPEEEVVRSALCVEPRDDRLWVFLPPLSEFEPWLRLVAVVEEVAAALGQPVVLEGHEPPGDPLLRTLSVTPDPGVIEVNVHPAASWAEWCATSTALHEAARAVGLRPDRFEPDGRHVGTGGGSHVTLGGPTPEESPFLRRPDLLVSLLTFWQHHPGLSYLFAGKFVGPTSQAPRVDEARHDTLYELEIAFEQLDRAGPDPPPELVDRLFRDLLTDVTGNTHRAEFCIDKLFSPEGPAGRLGVVELRGLEMPPDPAMGLVRVLLLRTLVARFWRRPYRGRLARWGTRLHDQFLLEHHVSADVAGVCADLERSGYPFRFEWLRPQIEHRFPRIGSIERDGVELELRYALEPWNVLGEDVAAGRSARLVDWSTERLQVRLSGDEHHRYLVLCNGRRVPLQPTEEPGTQVAGVRFRARELERCLHPTMAAQSPLTFDLVDLGSGRALASCTYEVWDPAAGPAGPTPASAAEARARRAARFRAGERAPGRLVRGPSGEEPVRLWELAGPTATDPDCPGTLDLRLGAPAREQSPT